MNLRAVLLLFISFFCLSVCAQSNKVVATGNLDGLVRDSVHNYALQTATVAIYRKSDSTLVNYQLTNNFGEFHFDKLPLDTVLVLKASFVSYVTVSRVFKIPSSTKKFDLKNINLDRVINTLNEVVIKAAPPPVRMNGDTLEFNADAFKLDTNAVVEDLLKKLPGVEIWGDGVITVNGKTVNKVFVEGKEFFGGDTKVAIQNLPKNSVSKIQVYEENKKNNPIDPATDVNIVLKKNKKDGFFGKIEGGYGTDRKYDDNAMINYFDPQNQFSIAGSANNVNKTANSVTDLFSYTSYKGEGVGNSYTSDFNKQGLNVFKSIGFTAAHAIGNKESLNANYFINDLQNNISQNITSTSSLSDNSTIKQLNKNSTNQGGYSQNGSVGYKGTQQYSDSYLKASFNNTNQSDVDQTTEVSNNSASNSSASYLSKNSSAYTASQFSLQAGYHSAFLTRLNHDPLLAFNLDYTFNVSNNSNDRSRTSETKDDQQNTLNAFNRRYNEDNHIKTHLITFSKDDILGAGLSNILTISVLNDLGINQSDKNYETKDFQNNQYVRNDSLSYTGKYEVIDERPALELKKTFAKSLSDRFSRMFSIDIVGRAQLYNQQNTSTLDFQNINHKYHEFIPSSVISYRDTKMHEYDNIYSINYNTEFTYPQLEQLVPLVDQADGLYLNYGNLRLRPSYRREFVLSFSHTNNNASATPFIYKVNLKAGVVNDYLSDSTLYDNIGRTIHYTVNVNQQKYADIGANLLKSYKIQSNLLQLGYQGSVNFSQYPIYINSTYLLSKTVVSNNVLDANYSYSSILALKISQALQTFTSVQQEGETQTESKNINSTTAFAASLTWPKHITLNSSVNYNRSTSPGAPAINFTIWNASLFYRFLKAENAEVKFSALDLLHQNTGLISYGNNNNVTRGTATVLHQYFMLTLSYYPRKFGLNNKH